MDRKKAVKICNNFLSYYFNSSTSKPELDYDCKPFMNLVQAVWEDVCSYDYSDSDITYSTIEYHILRLKSKPLDDSSFYSSLVSSVKTSFEKNKGEHFVIIPLHGSRLNQQISFGNKMFYLIPAEENEQTLFHCLSDVMNINYDKCVNMFEHTKNSRSQDFFKHNLLLIRLENQTSNVKSSAITIAIHTIYLIHMLYWTLNETEDILFFIKSLSIDCLKENHHVVIMSNDEWRCGHGNTWNGVPKCKLDLKFLEDKKYQKIFLHLFTEFIIEPGDELTHRFVNSLVLLNRGFQFEIKNDSALATLLYTTSAEALLAAGKNEKRLRFAAILSKLICIEGKTQTEIANILESVYKKRNNFVHAGQSPFYEYHDDDEDDLVLTRIAISKLILKYNEITTLLSTQNEDDRSKKWDSYIDQLFRKLLFG